MTAARKGDSLTHLAVHALATGEVGIPAAPAANKAPPTLNKGLVFAFGASEWTKKLNNPTKTNTFGVFLSRIAENSPKSTILRRLCQLGLASNIHKHRRRLGEILALEPDATAKLDCRDIHIGNVDNCHFTEYGKAYKQTIHISYTGTQAIHTASTATHILLSHCLRVHSPRCHTHTDTSYRLVRAEPTAEPGHPT